MAAEHGSNTTVLFDQFNLTGYFTQASMSKSCQVVDVTPFGVDDRTYIAGNGEGSLSLQGLWDSTATSGSDEVLDAALGTDTVMTVGLGTQALGSPVIMLQALDTSYQIRHTTTDAVRVTANATANGGIRVAGRILQPLGAETTTENGASVDNGASTAFGGVGHIHVTAFSGTDATVKIQDSANDTDWADLITFTQVTGVTSERTVVTGTVDQYLRYAITADNFTSMTLAVCFARYRR